MLCKLTIKYWPIIISHSIQDGGQDGRHILKYLQQIEENEKNVGYKLQYKILQVYVNKHQCSRLHKLP